MEPEEPPLPVEAEVGRLVGGRLDPSEALRRKLLDPWRGGSTRQLRRELRILSAQVGALTAEVVELHVQAQDGDVGRDDDRGLAAVSAALGRIAFREVERSSGVLPHTQTGKSGGQSQPRSRSRMKRLTIRSSSEWQLITASRPPGRSIE